MFKLLKNKNIVTLFCIVMCLFCGFNVRANNATTSSSENMNLTTTFFINDRTVSIDTIVTLQCGQTVHITGVLQVNNNGQVTSGELHIEEVATNGSSTHTSFHYVGENNSWILLNEENVEISQEFFQELEELLQNIVNNIH